MEKLLLVVDYQTDFVEGSLGCEQCRVIENAVYNKIKSALDQNISVIFTMDTHRDETYMLSREGRNLPIPHCLVNSDGWHLYGKTREFEDRGKYPHLVFLNKGNFGSRDIIGLQGNEFDEIEIIGIITNMCVISNAILMQTRYPNANITIDASCCASFDEKLHNEALDVMQSLHMNISGR